MKVINNLSIQFVAKVTGINPHTIRAWEKRYRCLTPPRDHKGRRLYNEHDVMKLQLLHELTQQGNNISEMANLNIEQLQSLHKKYFGVKKKSTNNNNDKPQIDLNTALQSLLIALKAYRLDIISHELKKLKTSIPPRDLALGLLAPLLREIGDNVSGNFLSIAQEHALSSLLRFHVGQILAGHISELSKNSSKIFLITTPEGERHEFGILIAALLCCHYKIKFYYLGVDLPYEALIDANKQIKADSIILGVSKGALSNNEKEVKNYVANLRQEISENTEILVGGVPSHFITPRPKNTDFLSTIQMLDMKLSQTF